MLNSQSLKRIASQILPYRALVALRRYHYCRVVKNFRDEEEPDLKIVKRIVKRGDFVLDIGANIGVYTAALSRLVGSNGTVISFEPIPPTFAILQDTVSRLGFTNSVLVNCALGEQIGRAVMGSTSGSEWAGESLSRAFGRSFV